MTQSLTQIQVVTVIALLLFSVLMVSIGFYSAKKARTMEGFLLGNRQIGPWISAFAYATTYFSAVIFIGYAGQHGWNIGFADMWIGIGNAILGCWLAWILLAKRTRNMTNKLGSKTMPEFFGQRYGSTSMKVYSAAIIFIFLVPYSAAVYKGLGSLFTSIFPGTDIAVCMAIVAILTAIYLVFGGYVATAYTDFVQGIIMAFGAIVMVFAIVYNHKIGGFGNAFNMIRELGNKAGNPSMVSWFGGSNWRFLAVNIMLTSFGTWGLPQMVTKYYAIKNDNKSIKAATIISTVFALIIGCSAYFVGSLGRIFVPVAQGGLPKGGYDFVVPQILMNALGYNGNLFTTIILAIVMLLLLSASMSTLSSIVLSSSSAVTVDFIPVVFPKFSHRSQMVTTRILCLVFVALSYIFATANVSFIVNLMSLSWGVVAGCFIGPFMMGLYYKKTTRSAAWCGLLTGVVVVLGATTFNTITLGSIKAAMAFTPQIGVTAMAISVVITFLVSLFTKDVPQKEVDEAF